VEEFGWPPGEKPGGRLRNFYAMFTQFPHQCMYDSTSLIGILDTIGFRAARRTAFDSRISGISEVELKDRTVNAVIVEAIKP
jgi:hypothetical protein